MRTRRAMQCFLVCWIIVIVVLSSTVTLFDSLPSPHEDMELESTPVKEMEPAVDGENWLTGWTYRQQHVVNKSDGADENYTVMVTADGGGGSSSGDTCYLDGKMQPDFDDVRFTSSDGSTLLSYYNEMTVDAEEQEYFYGTAKSGEFYGGTRPAAYYDLNNERTYVAFFGPNYDAYVIYYDHQTDDWSDDYKAGTNPIGDDYHGAPVLWVNTTGHVHILFGAHENALQHRVTSNPNDISVWEDSTDIPFSEKVTYPRVSYDPIGNVVHVWYRSTIVGNDELDMHYTNSTDNGYTWNTYQKIVDAASGDAIYPQLSKIDPVDRDIIHLTWRVWNYALARETGLHYAYLNVTTGELYNVSGSNLGTSISGTEIDDCEFQDVITGQRKFAQSIHIAGDNVYVIFSNYSLADTNSTALFMFWNGTTSSWTTPEVIYTTPAYQAPDTDYFVYDETNISAFLLVGKNVTEFTWDGSTWTLDTWIRNSTTREIRNSVCPTYWNNTHDEEIRVLYSEWETNAVDVKAWAWGTNDNLNRTYAGYANYWVKITGNLTDADQTIYVYYGNPDTGSIGDGFATFPSFLDKTNTSGWTTSNIDVTTSGDYLRFNNSVAANAGEAYRYDLSMPTNHFVFMARFKGTSLGSVDTFAMLLLDGSTSHRFSQTNTPRQQDQDQWWYYDGALKYGGGWTEGTEYIFEHHVDGADSATGIDLYRRSLDRELLDSVTGENFALGSPTDLDGIYVGDGSGSANCDVYVYHFAWRSFIDDEPAHHTWGDEELGYFDYVDQISTEDAQADIGTHSSFADQQSAPDSTYDTLTEADTGGTSNDYEDAFDSYSSDIDSYSDVGTETNPTNAMTEPPIPDSSTMSVQEANQAGSGSEWLNCNAHDTTQDLVMTLVGDSPYLNEQDQPTHYVWSLSNTAQTGWYDFPTTSLTGTLNVNISIYCNNDDGAGNDRLDVMVDYTGSGAGADVGDAGDHTAWQYDTIDLGSHTVAEVNALRVWFNYVFVAAKDEVRIDHVRIGVSASGADDYELDFEYQWTDANYSETYEEVCIYVTTGASAENLTAWEWTGSAWASLGTIDTIGWNNFTASYITGSNYYVKLNDTDQADDGTQDDWDIDTLLIHTWSTSTNYRLDLEEQWIAARYDQDTELLCIKWGSVPSANENLNITVWNSTDSSWNFLYQVNSSHGSSWTNISITTWLDAAIFTIRFIDTNQTSDSDTQDTWQKDSCLLWTYPAENVAPENDQAPVVGNPDDTDNLYARLRWYYFEVNVSDGNGVDDISHVDITLASNDRGTEYWTLRFNNTSNAFSNTTDLTGKLELDTSNSQYYKSGNDLDLEFWIMLNWTHPDATDVDAKLYVEDNSALSDTDWYEVDYKTETRLEMSVGPTLNDGAGTAARGDFDATITASGTIVYYGNGVSPPADEIDIWVNATEYGANAGPWNATNYEDSGGTFSITVYADDALGQDTFYFEAYEQDLSWGSTNLMYSTESATYIADQLNITIVADSTTPANGIQVNFTITVEYDYDDTTCTTYVIQIARNGSVWYTFEDSNKTLFNDTNSNAIYLYNATSDGDGVSETLHGLSTSNVFLTLTETVTWSGDANYKTVYEVIVIDEGDYLTIDMSRQFFDSVTIADVFSRTIDMVRTFSENVGIAETISNTISIVLMLFEALSVAVTLTTAKSIVKALSEGITLIESIENIYVISRTMFEGVTIIDTITNALSASRTLFEGITLSDAIYTETVIQKYLFESIALAATISTAKSFSRQFGENIILSPTFSEVGTFARELFESITFDETVYTQQMIQKYLFESITLSPTFSEAGTFARTLYESVLLSPTFSEIGTFARTFFESITFDETVYTQLVIQKYLFEAVVVTATIGTVASFSRSFGESIVLSPTFSEIGTFVREFFENIIFADSVETTKIAGGNDYVKNLFESITLSDSESLAYSLVRVLSESITISDTTTTTFLGLWIKNLFESFLFGENDIWADYRAVTTTTTTNPDSARRGVIAPPIIPQNLVMAGLGFGAIFWIYFYGVPFIKKSDATADVRRAKFKRELQKKMRPILTPLGVDSFSLKRLWKKLWKPKK